MTDHGAQRRPEEPTPLTSSEPASAVDAGRELMRLAMAYPAFRFRHETVGRHGLRWIAERRDGLSHGLHTVITADLGELQAALVQDSVRSGPGPITRNDALRALL